MKLVEINALPEHTGRRIDVFISEQLPELSRSGIQRLCAEGRVTVDGVPCDKNYRLKGKEEVAVTIPPARPLEVAAQSIPLDIVWEDESLIVINKPQGLVVHPAPGNEDGTLVNALLAHCGGELPGIGGVERPGIVHRLDKMTSGLIVVAKTEKAHLSLTEQMKNRKVEKLYMAVVHGCPKQEQGNIDAPIGRHPTDRKKMSVTAKVSREARTDYEVLASFRGFSQLELRLHTGRTHQIRVHMASIGHPVAGDALYGPKKPAPGLQGQCLHAKTLGFCHPVSGRFVTHTSRLPEYFERFLARLESQSGEG